MFYLACSQWSVLHILIANVYKEYTHTKIVYGWTFWVICKMFCGQWFSFLLMLVLFLFCFPRNYISGKTLWRTGASGVVCLSVCLSVCVCVCPNASISQHLMRRFGWNFVGKVTFTECIDFCQKHWSRSKVKVNTAMGQKSLNSRFLRTFKRYIDIIWYKDAPC